jgi:hypothetical protein
VSALKRTRNFTSAKDDASADELRRQLVQFESNVSDMGDAMDKSTMQRLSVKERDGRVDTLTVGPGQSVTIISTVTRVQLDKPRPGDEGKFLAICKGGGAASNTLVTAPVGAKINDTATFLITTSYMILLVYCDGVNYWAI